MHTIKYTNIGNASVDTVSTEIVDKNEARMILVISNPSNTGVFINFGNDAEDNKGGYLGAKGGTMILTIGDFRLTLAVNAITPAGTSGTKLVSYLEGY